MYKLSKFNYVCENQNGDLLLFNTYVGMDSKCKIKSKDLQSKFLNNLALDNSIIEKLLEKGLIVPQETNEDLKLYHLLNEILSSKNLLLTISPTECCNFRCKYCYESHANAMMMEKTKNNIISYIKNNIHKFTKLDVSWFGGEPLLAIDTIIDLSNDFISSTEESIPRR